ncbi:EamA family transporter [Candidatus Bathyarchaeota archaeon]|nr:EamA family transporter [Candidatus Bathyarchaeota archaeon]
MGVLAYLLLAVMFWGIAPIFGKLGLEKISPILAISIRSFGISIILLIVLLVSGQIQGVWNMNRRSAGLILAEGICAGLLGHFAYYYALKAGEVSYTVLLARSAPIVTVILSYVILGDRLTPIQIGGVALILTGSILMNL